MFSQDTAVAVATLGWQGFCQDSLENESGVREVM